MVKSLNIKSGSLVLSLETRLSLRHLLRTIMLLLMVIPEILAALFKSRYIYIMLYMGPLDNTVSKHLHTG